MLAYRRICKILFDNYVLIPQCYVRTLNPRITKVNDGRRINKNDEFSQLSPEERSNLLETAENFQAIQTIMNKSRESPKMFDEIAKKEYLLKYWLNKKIIERKYFKKEPELNLLTYDAKEQIRYLHAENPEEWTPEVLSRSFPISEEGIRKLLKSKCKLRSLEEIVKHDKRVIKHWQALKSGEKKEIASRYLTYLKTENRKEIDFNSLGGVNKSLPIPKKLTKDIVLELTGKKDGDDHQLGTFESMVVRHLELKNLNEVNDGRNDMSDNSKNDNSKIKDHKTF